MATTTLAPARPWVADAACVGADPELFFPRQGESTSEAKAVCAGCNVRAECLDYAQSISERRGIWGGLSERERRRMRSRPASSVVEAAPPPGPASSVVAAHPRSLPLPPQEGSGTPPPCPLCGEPYPAGGGLRQHLADAHAQKPQPKPAPAPVPSWRRPQKVERPELPLPGLPPRPAHVQACPTCGVGYVKLAAHLRLAHQRLAS